MILAKVVGSVVSTNKVDSLMGKKLLIVEEWDEARIIGAGQRSIAIDTVGAGPGELVVCTQGGAARIAAGNDRLPIDLAIIGIVDSFGNMLMRELSSE